MTLLAQTYLGNWTTDPDLCHQLQHAAAAGRRLEVTLTPDDCRKSRILADTANGTAIGIVKTRGWTLTAGDVFETADGDFVVVQVQHPEVLVLSLPEDAVGHAAQLVQLGHTLGNHHWPIAIVNNKVYVPLVVDRQVIETTLRHLPIPGLTLHYEARSPEQPLPLSTPPAHAHP